MERQPERYEYEEQRREPRNGRGGGNGLQAIQMEHADHEIDRLPVVRLESAHPREHYAVGSCHEDVAQKEHADQTPHRDEAHDEIRKRELHAAGQEGAEVRCYQHRQAQHHARHRLARKNAAKSHGKSGKQKPARAQKHHEQQHHRQRDQQFKGLWQEGLPHLPHRFRKSHEQRSYARENVEYVARPVDAAPERQLFQGQDHVAEDQIDTRRTYSERHVATPD